MREGSPLSLPRPLSLGVGLSVSGIRSRLNPTEFALAQPQLEACQLLVLLLVTGDGTGIVTSSGSAV